MMNIDYGNLGKGEGKVSDVHVWMVSVVGNRIVDEVGVPGHDVWFLVSFYVNHADHVDCLQVRCLTQDGVFFRPFEWTNWLGGSSAKLDMKFKFIGDSVGGGRVWLAVGDCVREKVGGSLKKGIMNMNYDNLEGREGKGMVRDARVGVVSVVGNRIVDDVSVPGHEVWFLVSFYVNYVSDADYIQVRCLTQDGVRFRPFEWGNWRERSGVEFNMEFKFVGDSEGYGGGKVWAAVGDYVREFIERGGDDEH